MGTAGCGLRRPCPPGHGETGPPLSAMGRPALGPIGVACGGSGDLEGVSWCRSGLLWTNLEPSGSRGPWAGGLQPRHSGLDTPGRAGWRGALGALAPPASRTVTKAEPPAARRDSTRLCPRAVLSLPDHGKGRVSARLCLARAPLFSGWTKPARSQPPGRIERFSVWIIQPQKACGPFASISWAQHSHPSGLSGLSGEKIPTGPRGRREPWKNSGFGLRHDTRSQIPVLPEAWGVFPPLPAPAAHLEKGCGPPT